MSSVLEQDGTATIKAPGSALRDAMVQRLGDAGSVGTIVVDLAPLECIETVAGIEKYAQIAERIESAVRGVVGSQLAEGDMILRSGGVPETLEVLFFRDGSHRAFYEKDMPGLAAAIQHHLAKNAPKLVFPFLRATPPLPTGHAIALKGPGSRAERVISMAIKRALRRARLNRELTELDEDQMLASLVASEDITAVYEPIVHLENREIYGYEALARGPWGSPWQSPERLFGVAARSGLAFDLDCLCRRAAMRGAANRRPPNAKLFLNCLPSAINDPAFRGNELIRTLEAAGMSPKDLVLEISERETIENYAIFRRARDYFRELGISIALDDTGSGYASMAAAMDVSPDIIKIDMTLVRAIDTDAARQALVRALVQLSMTMGADVVAEGIEQESELETLKALGVTLGQGYLFGRAAPFDGAPHPAELD